MNSCGTPRPERGIGCGKTSGRDGWQVGAHETWDRGGGRRRGPRRPPGPTAPPPPPLWAPSTGFLRRQRLGGGGCSHHPCWAGLERPRSPRSRFPCAGTWWVWAPPGALTAQRGGERRGAYLARSSFAWPLRLGWPLLRRHPPHPSPMNE